MNTQVSFRKELSRFPAPVAAELEDHLIEEYDRQIRAGTPPEAARCGALATLGDLHDVGEELSRRQVSWVWCFRDTPALLKLLVVGWVLIGLFCLLRIVQHHAQCCTPALDAMSSWSFGVCLVLGLGGALVSLMLLRRSEMWRCVAMVFFAMTALGFCLQGAAVAFLPFLLPIESALLLCFAAVAGLSAWLTGRSRLKYVFA